MKETVSGCFFRTQCRCKWEYFIACQFDSLCKIENWEPANQIC